MFVRLSFNSNDGLLIGKKEWRSSGGAVGSLLCSGLLIQVYLIIFIQMLKNTKFIQQPVSMKTKTNRYHEYKHQFYKSTKGFQ